MKLNLPDYNFRMRVNTSGKDEIFDEFRKKFVVLTSEEWVRQNFIRYLKEEKNYPSMLIAIEKEPVMLIEFKSSEVKINQQVMEQISRYNMSLNVNYLIISNGLLHYCCYVDKQNNSIKFMDDIPEYDMLNKNRS